MKERIVFMGTASFSLAVLQMLLENQYHVVGVVTQPDRYVGRKKVLTMPDVKVEALKYDIPVIQPVRIKEDYQAIFVRHHPESENLRLSNSNLCIRPM